MNAETTTSDPQTRLPASTPARIPNESVEYRTARTALARRGNRTAPSYRARRRAAAGAASRRGGDRRLRFRGRGRPGRFRRAVRRQADARDLQLYVRTATRAPLSDVHQSFGRLGGQRRRHCAEDVARGRRALSDRAPDRVETGARLAEPPPLQRLNGAYSRDYFAHAADGTDEPAFNVFTRRDGTIRHFWSDEMSGTSPPTPARTRAARLIPRRCGWCSTRRPRGGG